MSEIGQKWDKLAVALAAGAGLSEIGQKWDKLAVARSVPEFIQIFVSEFERVLAS